MSSDTPTPEPTTPVEVPAEPPVKRRQVGAYIVLIIIAVAALGFVWFYRFNTSTPILTIYPSQTLVSADWGGYAVSSDLITPQKAVTSVSGSWVVPQVAPYTDSFSAAWVGIGGQYDESLIQTGTEHTWINGSYSYSAWYELLPQDSIALNMTVSPGDTISASLTLQNAASKTWVIEITNLSNGQTFRKSVYYDSSQSSAEWVVERPVVNNNQFPLANFGKLTFKSCSATIGGRTGGITSFPHSLVIMRGRMNNDLVKITDAATNGTSFEVDFLSPR
jgi:hypothetical protein